MKKTLLIYGILITMLAVKAQPGSLDRTFDPGRGVNGPIRATAIQADGKILIGGLFTSYDGYPVHYIARLLPGGALDTSFHIGTGANDYIHTIAVQPDGRIIIGGNFTTYQGAALSYIARLHMDGSIDTSFRSGTALNSWIHAMALQTDGKILIGGDFSSYGGTSCVRLARLNADGTLDVGFSTGSGANGPVECIAIQPDGKILIGGSFTFYNSTPCLRLERINTNGTPDLSFNFPVGGASSTIWTIKVQASTSILIGGEFLNYNGNSVNYLLRIGSNGSIDNTFRVGGGVNSTVSAITEDSARHIVVAGNFTSYNSSAINRVLILDQQGILISSFHPGSAADNELYSVSIQHDGKIIIAGMMTDYDSISRNGIARLYDCVTPQPGPISGLSTTPCAGGVETYSIAPVAGADSYVWTLPSGWLGSSDSTTIIATSDGTAGVISVRAYSELCGYSDPQTESISLISPPGVNLCMVTVDTQSSHNVVIWEKPRTTLIDSFFIYREITTNVYARIAAIPYDSLSEYHDYGADPNVTSFKYKLSVLDHCGVESNQSYFHNTIHLQHLGNGNLQWTFYQIENSTNPVTSFNVYRDNLGNGNFSPIGFVPGSNATFSDITASSFPNCIYVVDVAWGISCTPTRAVNTTRSNIRHAYHIDTLGVRSYPEAGPDLRLYPNPVSGTLHISGDATLGLFQVRIINSMGQMVYARDPLVAGEIDGLSLDIGVLAKGVYMLRAEGRYGRIIRKFIVQ